MEPPFRPGAVLTLYTALEAYARERLGRHNLRTLRDLAQVDPAVIGCTNMALALIGASRDYFAHLGTAPNAPTVETSRKT